MIEYDGTRNKYHYNSEDLNNLIKLKENAKRNCTIEDTLDFVNAFNLFLSNIRVEQENCKLERHETEEEARNYFGEDFINQFDKLLNTLYKQKNQVELHGTDITCCDSICKTGLKAFSPSLNSTAINAASRFNIGCENGNIHFLEYEKLLNWPHKEYKGIVVLSIPYDCYDKVGLWDHFANHSTKDMWIDDYRINPDFVAGYLDIENKKVILNSKYRTNHDCSNYEKNSDSHVRKDANNDEIYNYLIADFAANTQMSKNPKNVETKDNDTKDIQEQENNNVEEQSVDIEGFRTALESFDPCLSGINHDPYAIDKSIYNKLLDNYHYRLGQIKRALPNLKTREQLNEEEKERELFNQKKTADESVEKDDCVSEEQKWL